MSPISSKCLISQKKNTNVDTVEDVIVIILVFFEDANILEDLSFNGDAIIVPDRIFSQEVENEEVRLLQGDMLASQGTTTNSICLIFPFFVTSTKSKFINEVHCGCALTVSHDFVLQLSLIVLSNTVDMFLQDHGQLGSDVVLANSP